MDIIKMKGKESAQEERRTGMAKEKMKQRKHYTYVIHYTYIIHT